MSRAQAMIAGCHFLKHSVRTAGKEREAIGDFFPRLQSELGN
jgi:hypothetical protein